MDFIDASDFDSFSSSIQEDLINKIEENKSINFDICKQCNNKMEARPDNTMICIKGCGTIQNVITENNEYEKSSSANYNTNTSYHLPIKCVGPGSYTYHKTIRNYTSISENIHMHFIRQSLNSRLYNDNKIHIPKYIIVNAENTYLKLKKEENMGSYRAGTLVGILASIIYYECLKNNIAVKHKELAEWMKVDISKLTKTDKIIKKLNINDTFQIKNINHKYIYIESFCKRVGLSGDHITLLYEVLIYIEEKKIGSIQSKLSTKAASLIYILVISDKSLNIKDTTVSDEFEVSLSTMKTFYKNMQKHYERINEIFNKYGVTLYKKN